MTPKQARNAIKARRKALRREVAAAKRARKAAERRSPARRKRRLVWRIILLLILLILYLMLRGCDCECGPGGPFTPGAPVDAQVQADLALDQGPDARVPDAAPPKRRRRRLRARMAPIKRPAYINPRPNLEGWLPALRLQVSARGPRMARCFEGSQAPGALRWRARVDVARGTVADHAFEPVLAGAQLTARLKRCLVDVLQSPPYRLPAPSEPAPPAQVSILIEF